MGLLWPACAQKKDRCVRPEFVNHLSAGAAGRAGGAVIIGHDHSPNLNLWTHLGDSGEYRGALGTIRHPVRSILHIAPGRKFFRWSEVLPRPPGSWNMEHEHSSLL